MKNKNKYIKKNPNKIYSKTLDKKILNDDFHLKF